MNVVLQIVKLCCGHPASEDLVKFYTDIETEVLADSTVADEDKTREVARRVKRAYHFSIRVDFQAAEKQSKNT